MKTLLAVILYAAFVSVLNVGGAVRDHLKAEVAGPAAPDPAVSMYDKNSHG